MTDNPRHNIREIRSPRGTELTANLRHIERVRQDVGMVFQQFNLFPHLTVLDNLCLARVWVKKMPRPEAEKSPLQNLARVKIPDWSWTSGSFFEARSRAS